MKSKVTCVSHALKGSPGAAVKYGVPENAVAPLMGGSRTRYRPGLLIAPPPTVSARRSLLNQSRLYAMKPRKVCDGASALSPPQLTPPPYSQPASKVNVMAPLEIFEPGLSKYFHWMLSSVCTRLRSGLPSVSVPQ